MKIAIIDIGSNSVRLMLWADGKTLYKKLCTTRLGAHLSETGVLGEEAMERSVEAVSAFCREADENGARKYAFATAAVRSAANGAEFCGRVLRACGVSVEIVSGEEEAQLGLVGALGGKDGGIIDIGGASTEVCFRRGGETVFSVSLPVGAVKLRDLCGDDAENLLRTAEEAALPLGEALPNGATYAIGGTASSLAWYKTGLAQYRAELLQGVCMPRKWVGEAARRLEAMSEDERRKIPAISSRADIIVGGALLLYACMKALGLDEVKFSDRDNLEGYLILRGLQ